MNTVTHMIMALLLTVAVGCSKKETRSQTEPAADKVGETANRPQSEAPDVTSAADRDKDEWMRKAEERLNQLDREIDELAARGSTAAHAAGDATMDNLQKARSEARDALQKARGASSDAWESTKTTTADTLDRLEAAYRGAAEGLEKKP